MSRPATGSVETSDKAAIAGRWARIDSNRRGHDANGRWRWRDPNVIMIHRGTRSRQIDYARIRMQREKA